ncbi:NAD(P)-dependent dehydrogenase (short-subunit alcohol dehydrogenase family) [Bacillus sp. SORGH_AS 510]|uniref:oxidoreductase n=1 Tax=Bacillus sp. SORGH_AS_0510 TaxID=3041771 RepID=UPI0027820FDE|nr:oxidoreductase [Bacillus sp. SORGH_AS_0510]MDQ1146386.1 NAD(P)-dependent dehydrogenase (short-subunit alcohol dehydrogenase family) [Bacillus sp. SORGH_AS_0510]
MNQPIAIVTGASSGFGLLTTLELAKAGFQVIATMRNKAKADELLNQAQRLTIQSNLIIHELDVTSGSSVERLAALIKSIGRVDVLVNNAGFAGAGFVEEITMEEYRKQFDTNFFGVIAVTKTVIPFMRRQKKGKIINVSSISRRIAFPGLSPYVASKHALEGWSESLRLELSPFGISVALIEPGSYKTSIWTTGKQVTTLSLQTDSPYFNYMKRIEDYISSGEGQFGNPKDVAEKIARIALDERPNLRYPIGKGVRPTLMLRKFIPWKLWEKLFIKRLC